jgi:penicillin-binding protein 1A
MVVTGALTAAAARRLGRAPLHMVVGRMPSIRAPYFVEEVRRFLQLRFGPEAAYAGGLRVSTTIDLAWQRSAERAVAAHLASRGDPAAALVAIDPRTGAIRAMVGGADFDRVKLNLATQAHRQAGSAFKPFALIAALEAGYSPASTWSAPAWTVVPDSRCETAGEAWSVTNASGHGYGELSLADATTWSVNTVYAQVTMAVMPEAVVDVAHRLGIGSPLEPVCSIALGTQDVTPLEMTSAYATLAAGGVHHAPATVAVVRDADGAVVDRPVDVVGRLAVDPNDAAVATGVLQQVVAAGTGRGAALPERPVAGKTGTAESSTDAWFCGYIPQLATCVWVGHPEGSTPMPGVHGGSIPASIWHDFMATVTDGMPVAAFADGTLDTYAVPAGVAPTLPTQPAASA